MCNSTMNKDHCMRGYKPSPINRDLYKKLKIHAIKNADEWPSRYASYELVNEYTKLGGKYFCKKKNKFGAPLGSFYPQGAQQNTFLTPGIKKCLNVIYGPADSSYTSSSYKPDILNSIGQNPSGFGNPEIKYLRSLIR